MTTERDFDRIARAWLDLMPDEAPDRTIAAVLLAAAATPQVRRLPRIGSWRFPVNRLSIIAAMAALVVALVGGAIFYAGSNNISVPTPVPTPTITTEPVEAFPEALWGLWVAEAEPIAGLPNQGSRITAGFNWDGGRDFLLGTNFILGSDMFASDALASTAGQFRMRSRNGTDGCTQGDVGTYGWERSADGLFLDVSLVDDPCFTRATSLARTWVRTLGVANDGRSGMATMFDPFPDIQVTLSNHLWAMDALPPVDIHTYAEGDPRRDLVILVNPEGYEKPCTTPGSLAYALEPTTAALAAYVESLPGMEGVTSEAAVIDGQPAAHITASYPSGGCSEGELSFIKQASFPANNGGTGEIRLSGGEQLSLWATVREGDLLLFWYAGENIPAAEEQAVIDSIRITNGLPTP